MSSTSWTGSVVFGPVRFESALGRWSRPVHSGSASPLSCDGVARMTLVDAASIKTGKGVSFNNACISVWWQALLHAGGAALVQGRHPQVCTARSKKARKV